MPKTFLDAMEVTRSLGLEYLWIDSLCILQPGKGSEEDRAQQVSDMNLVYANCAVNISADHGKSPKLGCFVERDPFMVQQCNIMWGASNSKQLLCTIVSTYNHGQRALKRLSLSSRAWVVQERLLSPRVLHFGAEHILWECAELRLACESVPFGLPEEMLTWNGLRPFSISQYQAPKLDLRSSSSIDPAHFMLWQHIVYEYSSCSLSKPFKDKLNALSAIAQRLGVMWEDKYVAWLFIKSIHVELLWLASLKTKRTIGPYRALSWSWASVDGEVLPVLLNRAPQSRIWQPLIELLSFEIDPVYQDNEFGAVKGANLRLRGIVVPAHIGKASNTDDSTHNRTASVTNLFSSTMETSAVISDGNGYNNRLNYDAGLEKDHIHLFPVIHMFEDLYEKELEYGLLLVPHQRLGGYERVGSYCRAPDKYPTWSELGYSQESDFDLY